MPEKITISVPVGRQGAAVACGVTVLQPAGGHNHHVALIYLHGGGLLYGERDDLPQAYLDLICAAGYTLFCLDYPLAPEAPLRLIRDALMDCLRQITQDAMEERGLTAYALFGRSAGAYLALLLAKCVRSEPGLPQPAAVISLYGYCDLTADFVWQPSAHYLGLPRVDRSCVGRLKDGLVVTAGPKALRFSLYVYARQTGLWAQLLGLPDKEAARACSLSDENLAALPPLFVAASTGDEDVPYAASRGMARRVPHARMKTVYYLEHDFDRDTTNPAGRETYEELLAWLDEVVT